MFVEKIERDNIKRIDFTPTKRLLHTEIFYEMNEVPRKFVEIKINRTGNINKTFYF